MKKALIVLLAAVPVSLQAQRIYESTNGSWEQPNHSIETFKERVFTGFSDRDPNTGLYTPTFKITDINGGAPYSFHTDFGLGQDIYLMDFTIRESHESIILAGFTQNFPYELVIAEIDFNGNPMQSEVHGLQDGYGIVPHRVIFSEDAQQVVVVGSYVKDPLDPANGIGVTKRSFVLGFDANSFASVVIDIDVDTPQGGFSDNDIFENITEIHGGPSGPVGYFISGSANDPFSGKQLLSALGIDYGGGYMHSNVWDNSNSRYAGASVLYSPIFDVVYLLANNSVVHEFEIGIFDPYTGNPLSTMHRHLTSSLPIGSNVDQNGFRLQETNDGNVVIAGYFTCWNQVALPNLITPFQMTLDPSLLNVITHKLFQSDNNFDPGGYFSMIGNSVYINTPDMMAYNTDFDRTFLVNPNSNIGGFDNYFSLTQDYLPCEEPLPTFYFDNPVTYVYSYDIPATQLYNYNIGESPTDRKIREEYLCWFQAKDAIADMESGATLFPNPVNDRLNIALDNDASIQTVAIYDLNGALIQSFSPKAGSEAAIDVSQLSTGAYLIDITDADGTVHRDKFMKN